MTKLYGAALGEQIRAERQRILDAMKRREIRIANGETDEDDCFLSMRSEEQNLRKCDMQLSILDTDGLMEFDGVFDADGKEVNVHPITNRWGKISNTGRGVYASTLTALLKKTGWVIKRVNVPCWVKFDNGVGGGMCAVYTGSYIKCRWHTNMVTGEFVGFPE